MRQFHQYLSFFGTGKASSWSTCCLRICTFALVSFVCKSANSTCCLRIPREQVDRRHLHLRAPPAACDTRVACVIVRPSPLFIAMPASLREQRLRLRRERRSEVGDEQREAVRL
jgi:hypothetical protein